MLDQWSRESLAIEVDVSLTGERVTRVLERLRITRGLPIVIQADNGPELRGRALDQWAFSNLIDFLPMRRPTAKLPAMRKAGR